MSSSIDPEAAKASPEVQSVLNEFHSNLSHAIGDMEKVVLIRALGNARHTDSIPIISKYLNDIGNEDTQTSAVYALAKFLNAPNQSKNLWSLITHPIGKKVIHDIGESLLGVWNEYLNPLGLRKSAASVILHNLRSMELRILDKLIDSLIYEMDGNAGKFLMDAIHAAAKDSDRVAAHLRR